MSIFVSLLVIMLLIAINGLFVAAEFAIIGVRPSRIEQLAQEDGNRRARWVHKILQDSRLTDQYIATAQLGITLASLGLGMIGEPAIAHFIEAPLHNWFGMEGPIVHTISFFVSLALITYLHVVIGEMVPKSISLQTAERAVLLLSGPMRFFERIFGIPVRILNRIGLSMLHLLRIPVADEESKLYGPEELELIVTESSESGVITPLEQQLVQNIFDFGERRVGQVMTPRTMLTAIPDTISQDKLLDLFANTHYSRLPVYHETIDNVIGILHLKDVLRQQLADMPFNLSKLVRKAPHIPESARVANVLASFKKLHQHLGMVIDEHGGVIGIVTLEDMVEEVVGEVRDEFDTEEVEPLQRVAPGHMRVLGTVLIEDVQEHVEFDTNDHDVQTVGGLVLAELGRPPELGDVIQFEDVKLQVEALDGLTIKRLSIYYPPEPGAEETE